MNKALVLTAVLLLASAPVRAQQSLSDQINAVDAVQQQQQQAEQAARQAEAQRAAQAAEAERRAEARAQASARKAAAQAHAAAVAARQKKEAEAVADKKRDQSYEDKLRELNLERQQLQLDAAKAHVARENEFIDQELKAQAAHTDVVKSQADANRNLSTGTKDYLEKTGDAEIKSQEGLFK